MESNTFEERYAYLLGAVILDHAVVVSSTYTFGIILCFIDLTKYSCSSLYLYARQPRDRLSSINIGGWWRGSNF